MSMTVLLSMYGSPALRWPGGLQSRAERVVYEALVRLIGEESIIVNYRPGDIAQTPVRDDVSAEFLVPALDLAILVNDEFTHPDPEHDAETEMQFGLLGMRVEWIWAREVLPELGGNAYERLALIDGLRFFGERRGIPWPGWRLRRYGQPPRDVSFREPGYFPVREKKSR